MTDAAEVAEVQGRRLGEFVLGEQIGEGGFATVYRCEQVLLGRKAVIKVLHHRLRASELVLQRFMREAQIASRLDHPYAAHIYAFGIEPDGLVWIAMELVTGVPLDRWLADHGPLSFDGLLDLFRCIAEVVQTAHERGIVHRDLKPSNIMVLERAGRLLPKLLDLGVAKLVDDAAAPEAAVPGDSTTHPPTDAPARAAVSNHRLTQANTTLGSPHYMSPEQWLDPSSVGPAADLYALGVMAFESLTGRLPYDEPTILGLANLHCTAPIPSLGPGFPPELDAVFQRILAKTPDARPGTAVAFVDELQAAVASVSAHAGAEATARPRRLYWLLGAAVLAAAAVTIAFTLRNNDAVGAAAAPPLPAMSSPSSPSPQSSPSPPPSPPAPSTAPTSLPPVAAPVPPTSPVLPAKRKTHTKSQRKTPPAPSTAPKPPEDLGADRL